MKPTHAEAAALDDADADDEFRANYGLETA